jgi:hypothetical protein
MIPIVVEDVVEEEMSEEVPVAEVPKGLRR